MTLTGCLLNTVTAHLLQCLMSAFEKECNSMTMLQVSEVCHHIYGHLEMYMQVHVISMSMCSPWRCRHGAIFGLDISKNTSHAKLLLNSQQLHSSYACSSSQMILVTSMIRQDVHPVCTDVQFSGHTIAPSQVIFVNGAQRLYVTDHLWMI